MFHNGHGELETFTMCRCGVSQDGAFNGGIYRALRMWNRVEVHDRVFNLVISMEHLSCQSVSENQSCDFEGKGCRG